MSISKLSIGIVGLPNVVPINNNLMIIYLSRILDFLTLQEAGKKIGSKSTLFKALTNKQVDIQNYPFTTIDPNVVPILLKF